MESYATRNIYDENGVLLLAKGQKINDAVIATLKKIGKYQQEEEISSDAGQNRMPFPIVQALEERINIRNDHLLKYANKILSTIIFESKSKPWWIYVNALSNYVDWLYTHSIDVAIISLMVAEELGYTEEKLWNIGLGAFLHDVGKLLIPRSIIQKPGPLNDMEMVYIRQHCELGMSSLEPCCLPRECTDIILQHHERLDGSGYPQGLKGDGISYNAKIVMIADVIDAITSGRPYKSAQKMDMGIKILRSNEKKFPQEVVSVLEEILK